MCVCVCACGVCVCVCVCVYYTHAMHLHTHTHTHTHNTHTHTQRLILQRKLRGVMERWDFSNVKSAVARASEEYRDRKVVLMFAQ